MSRLISLDNGLSYQTATEAMPDIIRQDLWDTIVNHMDDSTRENDGTRYTLYQDSNLYAIKEDTDIPDYLTGF